MTGDVILALYQNDIRIQREICNITDIVQILNIIRGMFCSPRCSFAEYCIHMYPCIPNYKHFIMRAYDDIRWKTAKYLFYEYLTKYEKDFYNYEAEILIPMMREIVDYPVRSFSKMDFKYIANDFSPLSKKIMKDYPVKCMKSKFVTICMDALNLGNLEPLFSSRKIELK